MRRFDKTKNMLKANILAESRYMESKGLIKEENCIETVNDKAELKSKISEKYDSDTYLIDECLEVIFNKKHTTPLEIVDTIEGNNKLIDLFIITHNSEQLKYILEVNPDNVTIDMCGLYKTISLYRNDDGDITRKMDKEFIEKYKYLDPSNRSELDEGNQKDRNELAMQIIELSKQISAADNEKEKEELTNDLNNKKNELEKLKQNGLTEKH